MENRIPPGGRARLINSKEGSKEHQNNKYKEGKKNSKIEKSTRSGASQMRIKGTYWYS
jgi:hypothetical protein